MSKECCIVGAAPSAPYVKEGTYLIAADGGLSKLEALGIVPDLILGDFDSLGRQPLGNEVLTYPVDKDDTDTLLAIKEALRRGCDRLYLSGGLGGKLDHTVANLQSLLYATERGAQAYLVGDGQTATVLSAGRCRFRAKEAGRFSVFALSERAEGVTLTGLRYPATDLTLTNAFPLGVSNHFTGEEVTVAVGQGVLLLIWDGLPEELLER